MVVDGTRRQLHVHMSSKMFQRQRVITIHFNLRIFPEGYASERLQQSLISFLKFIMELLQISRKSMYLRRVLQCTLLVKERGAPCNLTVRL